MKASVGFFYPNAQNNTPSVIVDYGARLEALGTCIGSIKHVNYFTPRLSYGELISHSKLLLDEILWCSH